MTLLVTVEAGAVALFVKSGCGLTPSVISFINIPLTKTSTYPDNGSILPGGVGGGGIFSRWYVFVILIWPEMVSEIMAFRFPLLVAIAYAVVPDIDSAEDIGELGLLVLMVLVDGSAIEIPVEPRMSA